MKNVLCVLALMAMVGCSRGSGVYVGMPVDIGWEGWFMQSCEVGWKTSEQSSTTNQSSSYSRTLCDQLMANPGKKYTVRWRQCNFCPGIDSKYEIESVTEVQ